MWQVIQEIPACPPVARPSRRCVTAVLAWPLGAFFWFAALAAEPGCAQDAAPQDASPAPLRIVVMDPLSRQLACECVAGYAQRDYRKLAAFLEAKLHRRVGLVYAESLGSPQAGDAERVDLIVGKFSVVVSDATRIGLAARPVAMLSGRDGALTQTGLFVVRRDDAAQSIEDLAGYRFLFGQPDSDEKRSAALAALEAFDVPPPAVMVGKTSCSTAALAVAEHDADVAIVSSYALPLLEGCGTVEKGELRMVGVTDPVPFIGVFATGRVNREHEGQLWQALSEIARLWRLEPPQPGDFNVPTPVAVQGQLLISTENNGTRLYGFDNQGRIQPEPLAVNEDLAPDTATPVAYGDLVFGSSGQLMCLDLKAGLKTLWEDDRDEFLDYCTVIGGNGHLLVVTQGGKVFLLRATGGELEVRGSLELFPDVSPADRDVWSHPALVGNRLYVRNMLGISCFVLDSASDGGGRKFSRPPSAAREAEVVFETELSQDEDRLRFFNHGDKALIDITDVSGMGKATIKRKTPRWPGAMLVRLHLSGLESFKAGRGDLQVEWWVSSGGDDRSWVALWRGKDDIEIDPTSPYFTKVRIVGGNGKVPLEGGYFEVPLPAKLLEGNPEQITLQWVDFYRR